MYLVIAVMYAVVGALFFVIDHTLSATLFVLYARFFWLAYVFEDVKRIMNAHHERVCERAFALDVSGATDEEYERVRREYEYSASLRNRIMQPRDFIDIRKWTLAQLRPRCVTIPVMDAAGILTMEDA